MIRDCGSVKLACALGFGLAHRGLLPGLGDLFLVRATGAGLAAAFGVLGLAAGPVGGLGLDLGAGGLQPGQTLLPPVQLGRQVDVFAVGAQLGVLGRVDRFGVVEQGSDRGLERGDLGLDLFLLGHQPWVAHRLVPGGVGRKLRAVEGHPAHPDHAQALGQPQRLHEQTREGVEVSAAEPGHRPEVRNLPGGQEPKRHIVDALALDRPRRTHPGGVAVDQQPHHQPRLVRRKPAHLTVVGVDRRQVEHLVDQLRHEPGQMPLRQPLVQRRRHQQQLVRIKPPKRLPATHTRPTITDPRPTRY